LTLLIVQAVLLVLLFTGVVPVCRWSAMLIPTWIALGMALFVLFVMALFRCWAIRKMQSVHWSGSV